MQISLNNYQKLLQEIQKIIGKTEEKIIADINHEKITMAWQIGKIIEEHLLKNNRANYGEALFKELEKDILISRKVLYQMRNFYKTYPTLPAKDKALNWTHYRNLLVIKSDERRKYLEDLAIENNLSSKKLQKIVRKDSAKAKQKPAKKVKLKFNRGIVFCYKTAKLEGQEPSFLDCGFNIFSELKTARDEGEIIKSTKNGDQFSFRKIQVNSKQLHTYKAYLERVIDGDTIKVVLDLGFKIQHRETLRLAQINAPESDSLEGKKSTELLKEILKNRPFLIIKTNKTDIYGRYIADVFLSNQDDSQTLEDLQRVADSGQYLNQMLLDLGGAEYLKM